MEVLFAPNKSDQSIQQQTTHESCRGFLFVCISCRGCFAGKNSHSRKAGAGVKSWISVRICPSWELSKWNPPNFETLQHWRPKSLDLFSLGMIFWGILLLPWDEHHHSNKKKWVRICLFTFFSASKSHKIQGSDFGKDLAEKLTPHFGKLT